MPIAVRCAPCGKTYNVPDNLAGKKIKCKGCEATLPVKAAAPAPTSNRPAAKPPEKPAAKPAAKPAPPKKKPARADDPFTDPFTDVDSSADNGRESADDDNPFTSTPPSRPAAPRKGGGIPTWIWLGGGALALMVVLGSVAAFLVISGAVTRRPPVFNFADRIPADAQGSHVTIGREVIRSCVAVRQALDDADASPGRESFLAMLDVLEKEGAVLKQINADWKNTPIEPGEAAHMPILSENVTQAKSYVFRTALEGIGTKLPKINAGQAASKRFLDGLNVYETQSSMLMGNFMALAARKN